MTILVEQPILKYCRAVSLAPVKSSATIKVESIIAIIKLPELVNPFYFPQSHNQ